MKLLNIILEMDYKTYEGMVQVSFGDDSLEKYDDALRALPGVTTITKASSDAESRKANYKVKLISQKSPEEAFNAFKTNAESKYDNVINVEIASQTIEEK